jgi:hypothetical protein
VSRRKTSIRIAIVTVFVAVIASFVLLVWDRTLRVNARERENHFLSVQFMIQSYRSDYGKYPDTLDDAFELFTPEIMDMMFHPFSDGLYYHTDGEGCSLAEPKMSRISFAETDRLVFDPVDGGRWEQSGRQLEKR